jgi:phosphate uptake regulator
MTESEIIRETISITRRSVTEEDKEVAALYTQVVKKGLNRALYLLRFGTPSEKLRIATASMSSAARLAAVDAAAEIEEHRVELERMMDEITTVADRQIVISGPEARPQLEWIDAGATAVVVRPDDQD